MRSADASNFTFDRKTVIRCRCGCSAVKIGGLTLKKKSRRKRATYSRALLALAKALRRP
jgi:hypothetical protein